MKLGLDHHYSPTIAKHLRVRGYDVVAALEQGWEQEDDEPLLGLCAADQRTLVTNNVSDFTRIVQRWTVQGKSHAGLVFTSDASLPRTRATIGKYVQSLESLLAQHPQPDAFIDRIHWL